MSTVHENELANKPGWRFPFLSLSVLTVVLATLVYGHIIKDVEAIRREKQDALKAVCDLKVGLLTLWRTERTSDASRIAQAQAVRSAAQGVTYHNDEAIRDYLNSEKTAYNYDDVLLVDANGTVLFSASGSSVPIPDATAEALARCRDARDPVISAFFPGEDDDLLVDVVAAVRNEAGAFVAGIVLRSKVRDHLLTLIPPWPVAIASAATRLVFHEGDDAVVIGADPAASHAFGMRRTRADAPNHIIARAVRGQTGFLEGLDLRDKPVLAFSQPVPGTPWWLITKIDQREIRKAIIAKTWPAPFMALTVLAISALIAGLVNRARSAHLYRDLYQSEHARQVERARAEEGEQLLKTALRNSTMVAFQQDADLRYTRVFNLNPGLHLTEVLGRTDHDLLPAEDADRLSELKRESMREGRMVRGEVRTTIKGHPSYYDLIIEPMFDDAGRIAGITGASYDITERKAAEVYLKRRITYEELLARISLLSAEATDIPSFLNTCLADMGNVFDVSRSYIFDYHPDSQTVDNTYEWTAPGVEAFRDRLQGIPSSTSPTWAERLLGGEPVAIEDIRDFPDPELRELARMQGVQSCLVVPLTIGGHVHGFLGFDECRSTRSWPEDDVRILQAMARSISGAVERSLVRAQLDESNRVFDLFMENSPIYVFIYDHNLRAIRLSRNYEGILGKPISDLLGKPAKEAFGGEFGREIQTLHEIIMRDGRRVEREEHIYGRVFQTTLFPIFTDGRPAYLAGFAIDVTARKQIEEDLRVQSSALAATANGVVITDRNGTIVWANNAFEKISGYAINEALGRNPGELVKSGRHDAAFYAALWKTITSGKVWTGEIVNRRKDGTEYPEELSITPVRDADGTITHFVAIKQDITEKRNLEEQFRQSQKMEAIGRLAGGVAHDFNNLLTVIMSNAELATSSLAPGDDGYEEIQEIVAAGRRSADLTRQLLAFARQQAISPRITDLNDTIESLLKMLRRLIGEDIELLWKPENSIWPIYIDPSQVDQLLANLIVNARDAITEAGTITIETENTTLDQEFSRLHADSKPGDYVRLGVSDNGAGMTPEIMERIFEPFFTTKATGKGTGLGLATIYGIVRQNGGVITVNSQPGRGSRFDIYLPRRHETAGNGNDKAVDAPLPRGRETILLVEDEKALLKVTAMMLNQLGYKVLQASTTEEALSHADNEQTVIDLVLTDVVMPGKNGDELIKTLRARRPGLKCLFMSGYPVSLMNERGLLSSETELVEKPFSVDTISRRIREILTKPTA